MIRCFYHKAETVIFFPFSKSPGRVWDSIHPPSQWVPGVLSPGVMRTEREAVNSPPPSAKFKNKRSYTSTPFISICLQQVDRNILSSVSSVSKKIIYCSEAQRLPCVCVPVRYFEIRCLCFQRSSQPTKYSSGERTHSPPAAILSQPRSVGP
jgi:hypothetical protein